MAAFATSYIPTTTAAATRAADRAVMTGANFSNWYNQTEGTVFIEAATPAQPAFFTEYLSISDGTDATRHSITQPANSMVVSGRTAVGNVAQSALNAFIATINQPFKFAYAYKTDDFAASGGGGAVITDTSGAVLTASQMNIGGRIGSVKSCHIRRITYYPRRLANSELQGITA